MSLSVHQFLVLLILTANSALAQSTIRWTPEFRLIADGGQPMSSLFVEAAPDLVTGDWQDLLAPDEVPGLGSFAVDVSPASRFFRLREISRGAVVSVEDRGSLNSIFINVVLGLAGISATVQYGVQQFKITYRTLGPDNRASLASGLLSVPTNAPGNRPLLSLQHATIYDRDDAPSVAGSANGLAGFIPAGRGYITCLPDFLGFGDAPGLHPYVHSKASATAVIDMMRAARTVIADRNLNWDGRTFLAGYSQGGHATMAAHRMLEELHADEWTINGSVPMAGPYDFSGVMYEALINRSTPYESPDFLPYVLFGWEEVYGPLGLDSEILRPPYDTTLRPLFDGQTGGSTINSFMPVSGIPSDIFQPAYLAAIRADREHPLRQRLARNDLLIGWVPTAPMHLIHCETDELVPYRNSQLAFGLFSALGAPVTLSTPDFGGPGISHSDCATPALLEALDWLDAR